MQEQLRFHRQIIYDLAARFLEPLPGSFARLAYISSLRNAATGRYEHPELCLSFSCESVHQTLAKCHEELFERVLELPLVEQEEDLRGYIYAVSRGWPASAVGRKDLACSWIPGQAPDYLKDLFLSNWQALCELLSEGKSKAHSNK